ncbi:hypothetical protein A2U01_0116957, partial [Trifolium medium]|nr:hypothetical protein [Trifolium medium]
MSQWAFSGGCDDLAQIWRFGVVFGVASM